MQPAPATRDLVVGCSRCRYSSKGCARCKSKGFRHRNAAPREEMAQVVAAQRRQERATQQEVRREQRREASRTTGQHQRELLLTRLRRQLVPKGDQDVQSNKQIPHDSAAAAAARPNGPISKRQRNTTRDRGEARHESPHPEQPPVKYRRVAKDSLPRFNNSNKVVLDKDMTDIGDGEVSPTGVATGGNDVRGGSDGECSGMDIDLNLESPVVQPRSSVQLPGTGTKRPFLDMLHDNMSRRREARLSGSSPPSELLGVLPSPKRRRCLPQSGQKSGCFPHSLGGNDPRAVLWEPPVSPYGLIEEELYDNPWKLLLACMLLNKTTGSQVRAVIWDLFTLCPTPQAAVAADTQQIQDLIQPLGLFRKRAVAIQRFSEEYLKEDWHDVMELHGIGKYAADAYRIFCRGEWREVEPEDKDLRRYKEWLQGTGGLGTGLMRSTTVGHESGSHGDKDRANK